MTVEERAQKMLEDYEHWKSVCWWEGKEELKARFVNYLRDQIEDSAKVADEQVEAAEAAGARDRATGYRIIAHNIRALAEPKEEKGESKR